MKCCDKYYNKDFVCNDEGAFFKCKVCGELIPENIEFELVDSNQ